MEIYNLGREEGREEGKKKKRSEERKAIV